MSTDDDGTPIFDALLAQWLAEGRLTAVGRAASSPGAGMVRRMTDDV